MNPTTYFRLYWKKSSSSKWSGGCYIETLPKALIEYKRLCILWSNEELYDFKIVEYFIEFEGYTKTTKETEHNPVELFKTYQNLSNT